MKDYLKGRQNALEKTRPEDVNARLASISTYFEETWLTAAGQHPIQILWQRSDAAATNQLALLGDALFQMGSVDHLWVSRRVQEIKTLDPNSRAGKVFELLGLNIFAGDGQRVRPTPDGTPGVDGTVIFASGLSLKLSLKNHASWHEQEFRESSQKIEHALLTRLKTLSCNELVLLIFAKRHPTPTDWENLRAAIDQDIETWLGHFGRAFNVTDAWAVMASGIPSEFKPLSATNVSYQVLVAAPQHDNEKPNLLGKLEAAAANLVKHRQTEPHVANALLVRIFENASVDMCAAWAREFFTENDKSALDAVLFYQPSVAGDVAVGPRSIIQCIQCVEGPGLQKWWSSIPSTARNINLRVLVGKPSNKPASKAIRIGSELFNFEGHYIYQKGEIFKLVIVDRDSETIGTLANPAAGIRIHAVMKMDDGEILMSGVFPPSDELILFS